MTPIPSSSKVRLSYFLLQPSSHEAIGQLREALEVDMVRQSVLQKVWRKVLGAA